MVYNKFKIILAFEGYCVNSIPALMSNYELRKWTYENCNDVYLGYMQGRQLDIESDDYEEMQNHLRQSYVEFRSSCIYHEVELLQQLKEKCILQRLRLLSAGIAWINLSDMIQEEYSSDYNKIVPKQPSIFLLLKSKEICRMMYQHNIKGIVEYDTHQRHKKMLKELPKGYSSMCQLRKCIRAINRRIPILQQLVGKDCEYEILSFNNDSRAIRCARYRR